MTQSLDTLSNIALAFAGELVAREERAADAQQAQLSAMQAQLNGITKLLEQGFSTMHHELQALKASDRELLSGLQNLQGQVTALQRNAKP